MRHYEIKVEVCGRTEVYVYDNSYRPPCDMLYSYTTSVACAVWFDIYRESDAEAKRFVRSYAYSELTWHNDIDSVEITEFDAEECGDDEVQPDYIEYKEEEIDK